MNPLIEECGGFLICEMRIAHETNSPYNHLMI